VTNPPPRRLRGNPVQTSICRGGSAGLLPDGRQHLLGGEDENEVAAAVEALQDALHLQAATQVLEESVERWKEVFEIAEKRLGRPGLGRRPLFDRRHPALSPLLAVAWRGHH